MLGGQPALWRIGIPGDVQRSQVRQEFGRLGGGVRSRPTAPAAPPDHQRQRRDDCRYRGDDRPAVGGRGAKRTHEAGQRRVGNTYAKGLARRDPVFLPAQHTGTPKGVVAARLQPGDGRGQWAGLNQQNRDVSIQRRRPIEGDGPAVERQLVAVNHRRHAWLESGKDREARAADDGVAGSESRDRLQVEGAVGYAETQRRRRALLLHRQVRPIARDVHFGDLDHRLPFGGVDPKEHRGPAVEFGDDVLVDESVPDPRDIPDGHDRPVEPGDERDVRELRAGAALRHGMQDHPARFRTELAEREVERRPLDRIGHPVDGKPVSAQLLFAQLDRDLAVARPFQ